jgi:hypothetical protein
MGISPCFIFGREQCIDACWIWLYYHSSKILEVVQETSWGDLDLLATTIAGTLSVFETNSLGRITHVALTTATSRLSGNEVKSPFFKLNASTAPAPSRRYFSLFLYDGCDSRPF